ncbi:MAG: hypothetical protein P0Y53_01310 [Candidatus Pseudobacter hemicellulosilyticus]|uniref:Uncharacterized protein n=1 Tax=Candidatus Pseudobacter hemicellulosilyticus TaxID=3121375 RepID=A0AAJ6BFX6_9BACT|nr:MAG: hypothetical protein P0Y53_01310 [Pseudobacter sp.]
MPKRAIDAPDLQRPYRKEFNNARLGTLLNAFQDYKNGKEIDQLDGLIIADLKEHPYTHTIPGLPFNRITLVTYLLVLESLCPQHISRSTQKTINIMNKRGRMLKKEWRVYVAPGISKWTTPEDLALPFFLVSSEEQVMNMRDGLAAGEPVARKALRVCHHYARLRLKLARQRVPTERDDRLMNYLNEFAIPHSDNIKAYNMRDFANLYLLEGFINLTNRAFRTQVIDVLGNLPKL